MFIIWVLIGLVLVVVFVLMGGLGMLVGTSVDVGKDVAITGKNTMVVYQDCVERAFEQEMLAYQDSIRRGIEPLDPARRRLEIEKKCAQEAKREAGGAERKEVRDVMTKSIDLTLFFEECMQRGLEAERMAYMDWIRRGIEPPDLTQRQLAVQKTCKDKVARKKAELERELSRE